MTTKPTERIDVLAVMDDLFEDLAIAGNYSGEGCWFADGEEARAKARYDQARAAVAELIEAADKAKAALLTGQIGHINAEDVGVYHLDGITCGNALNALRAALARFGVRA